MSILIRHFPNEPCEVNDEYYVAYKPITLPCILFMFIEIKFIHYHDFNDNEMKFIHCHDDHLCVIFSMKPMNIYND